MGELVAMVLFGADLGLALALAGGLAYVVWQMAREPERPQPLPPIEPATAPATVTVRLAPGPPSAPGPIVGAVGEWWCPACLDVRREETREHVPAPAGAMVYCRHHLRMLAVLYAEQDGSGERWWAEP